MESVSSSSRRQLSIFHYDNIKLDSTSQNQTHRTKPLKEIRDSTSEEIPNKNFLILEEFLKALEREQNNKEQAELASSIQFKQQWQNKRKQKYELKYSYFFRQNINYLSFSLILLMSQIVLLWFLSVFRVFRCQENRFVFVFCFLIQFLDLLIKSSYLLMSKLKEQNQALFQMRTVDWVELYLGNVYCIIYSILGISKAISSVTNNSLIILDVLAISFIYLRIQAIQNDIKMIKSSVEFKNYAKLFNLMSALIMIIHFFAVLMYFSTNFTENNFLDGLEIGAEKTWINFYVYSFYFSGTTVLTVGYGDILPKNIIEIFIVLLMQIFGVVMIVYLNGEVGNILCSLRREKENLENDLSVLERLKSSFNLSMETSQKIRQFLIDHRRTDESNNIQQQRTLLQKISSGLREQATLTNNINIIKQSLFLLTNFTTKAHISISNKLISRIYSPNQYINQVTGNQKLYFIKKGEVCFYISKKDDENSNCRKIVKKIRISVSERAQCNCFGYVSVIMGKKNRLKVYSNDFSDCYSIERGQFLQAINCDNQDFQKYHEMRESYMTDRTPEKNETQNLFNEKDHYICEVSKVIADYLKERHRSRRKNMFRTCKKRKLIIELTKADRNLSESDSDSEGPAKKKQRCSIDHFRASNLCLSIQERNKKYEEVTNSIIHGSTTKNLVVQRKYLKRHNKKKQIELQEKPNVGELQKLEHTDPFEIGCSFTYFYPDSNMDIVMRKINYYLKVLSIFVNMFEKTVARRVKKRKESNNSSCVEIPITSMTNIEKYRRQKDFIETINIKF